MARSGLGLDFTGHGASTVPAGGGYTAEILMGDVDAALAHLGAVTIHGRGLGAYIALLIAGGPARPGARRHPGRRPRAWSAAASTRRRPPLAVPAGRTRPVPPDPLALVELARDVRPPDYALTFVRFVVEGSATSPSPVGVGGGAPEWLAAVAAEPGVGRGSVPDGLATYAAL